MRDFDPRLVGRLEATAWITYYRRDWLRFLPAAIRLTRNMHSPLLPAERAALVRSYAALLAAVHR